jgi:hypothetical protein
MSDISVKIDGLEQLQRGLAESPAELERTLMAAGNEVGRTLLDTEGLQRYPASTGANEPPTPYYVRGEGTQYATYNANNSERLGTQFYTEASSYGVEIGNRASYAEYVVGENQARAMEAIGWRRLIDVAKEKLEDIVRIYDGWVARGLERLGLK